MTQLSDRALSRLQSIVDVPDFEGTRYRILSKIAEGGMGTVFRAHDSSLDREVAIKVMDDSLQDTQFAERMQQEAQVIARLEHPGIVPIHDVGILPDGRMFYAMKLVQGERLDVFCQTARALPERLRLFQKICEAVAFAHAQNIIHRDLKPANIMVGAFGEVLVMDWGLAKILGEEKASETRMAMPEPGAAFQDKTDGGSGLATQVGAVLGTPDYMAPEQARGENNRLDQRADVYALGAILQFVLTGSHPFQKIESQAKDKAPKRLQAIIRQAMAEPREQRYANASELAADIERFLNDETVTAYRDNPFDKIWRWLLRYKFLIFIVLIYMIVRVLLFYLMR